MRVDVEGNALEPDETVSEEPTDEKDQDDYVVFDPQQDALGKWLATFTHNDFARDNPDMSVYARIIRQLRIEQMPDKMMAVTIKNGRHTLMYNNEWAAQSTFLEVVATFAHEAFHILNRDIPTMLRYLSGFPADMRGFIHSLYNVAMDAANNWLLVQKMSHMKYGSTGHWVLPEPMGFPGNLDTDIYQQMLLERADQLKQLMDEIDEQMAKSGGQGQQPQPGQGQPEDGQPGEGEGQGQDQPEDGEPGEGEGQGQDQPGDGEPGEGEGQGDGGGPGQGQPQPGGPGGGDPMDNIDWDKYGPVVEAVMKLRAQEKHDWFDEKLNQMAPEELEARAANAESQARMISIKALKDHKKQIGNLPAHLDHRLKTLLEEEAVPWTAILSKLIAAQMLARRRATMTRPAKRRFILFTEDEQGNYVRRDMPAPAYPGSKREREFVILFAIDTSGSMSDQEVMEGLSEIQGLLKRAPHSHCIVLQCDTHISAAHVLGPDMDVEKYVEDIGRTSGGGTHFLEPFRLARALGGRSKMPQLPEGAREILKPYKKADLVVYHTDTYGATPEMDLHPGCPTLWTVPRGGSVSFNPAFGHVIVRE